LNKHERLINWARLLAGYSAVQAMTQALGLLAGILIIRALPKDDYAFFTIINTIGPVMGMLSDVGVNGGLTAIGGKHWQDDQRMGSLVRTAMTLRRQLVVWSCLLIIPVLVWMLWRNHAPLAVIAWLVPLTVVGVLFQLNISVLGVVMSLRQQISRMQQMALVGVLPRLALIAAFAGLGWLNAPLTVACGTVTLAIQFWLLERWVKPQINVQAPVNPEFRQGILAIVKKQAPFTVFYCLHGQINIWLISIFGGAQNVAEVGALARIGMIFSVLMSTISAVVVPRFARCQDLGLLRRRYGQILFCFVSMVFFAVFLSWIFPEPLIWLLGSQYKNATPILWLAVLGVGAFSIDGLAGSLNYSKGWIAPAAVLIPLNILVQIILWFCFDLSTVTGVLAISAITPIVPIIISLTIAARRLDRKITH
jgi:O-antigen/teichoic acid export membrane protein